MQHENTDKTAAHRATVSERAPVSALDDPSNLIVSSQDPTVPSVEPDNTQGSESEDSEYDSGEDAPVRKPRLPYKVGSEFTATVHSPPPPFGGRYTAKPPPQSRHFDQLTLTEYYLNSETPNARTSTTPSRDFRIASIIRAGTNVRAQVVVVKDAMVAKIYDPLFYSDGDEGCEQDFLLATHGEYSREAAAYQQIQTSPVAKAVTPAFYGTWTTEVPTLVCAHGQKNTHTRIVCMILLEYLQGECMQDVDTHGLPKRVRSRILKKVIHVEAIIFDAGVGHRDCHPRNVILLGSAYDTPDFLQVKIIDFSVSGVLQHEGNVDRLNRLKKLWPDKICSPVVRFYTSMEDFSANGWCSSKAGEAELWLWRHFKNGTQYYPVNWDPENLSKWSTYNMVHLQQGGCLRRFARRKCICDI